MVFEQKHPTAVLSFLGSIEPQVAAKQDTIGPLEHVTKCLENESA